LKIIGKNPSKSMLCAAALLLLANAAWSQEKASTALNLAQIVERMQQHDQTQAEHLEHYQALRHYAVEYRGFRKNIAAKMDVEITYDIGTGKSFRILSQSGSHSLCERVLKRAIDSEKEAAQNRGLTALTAANYRFHLDGKDVVGGRPAYILGVEPVTPNKFLYTGRIWVDAADFAVEKLDAQPAINPSFWISRTLIHNTYAKTCGFWLPQSNRSETKVRIGGTAILTIDYGTYKILSR
jgi:hypothetical protein